MNVREKKLALDTQTEKRSTRGSRNYSTLRFEECYSFSTKKTKFLV
jgi:hypothetical protein